MASNLCTKCGAAWNGETGKYPCAGGGQCDIPAARAGVGIGRPCPECGGKRDPKLRGRRIHTRGCSSALFTESLLSGPLALDEERKG